MVENRMFKVPTPLGVPVWRGDGHVQYTNRVRGVEGGGVDGRYCYSRLWQEPGMAVFLTIQL